MKQDDKIMKLDLILANSELVKKAEEHLDEDTVEEMLFELKKDLIKLIEE